MVTIAQSAEHLVVAQEVVGSSPIGHPYTLFVRPELVSGRFVFAGPWCFRTGRVEQGVISSGP